MSYEKSLSLSSAKRPAIVERSVIRRAALSEKINRQIASIEAIASGQPAPNFAKSRTKWWWTDGTKYFVAIYYARVPLELAKGKYSAQCVDLAACAQALTVLAKAVNDGAFDDQMSSLAGTVKAKFGSSKRAA